MTSGLAPTLDPAAAGLLARLRPDGAPRLRDLGLARARAYTAALPQLVGPGPEVGPVRDVRIPVDGGAIAVRHLAHPGCAREQAVVLVHGGGWALGGLDDQDALARHLVLATGSPVVAVDYRLAPEHPFPTPLEDVVAGMRWAQDEIGGPVVLVGESAGANLCAAAAALARDGHAPAVAGQVLVSPLLDHVPSASWDGRGHRELLDGDDLRWFWDLYCPESAQRDDPRASPLRGEAAGLPPTLLLTTEFDPLRDEGRAYAARLRDAGVALQHVHLDRLMHGFLPLVGVLPAVRDVLRAIGTHVRALTATKPLRPHRPRADGTGPLPGPVLSLRGPDAASTPASGPRAPGAAA